MKALIVPVLTALVVITAMVYQAMTPEVVLTEPPAVALGEIAGYFSEELPPSEAELNVLPADTRIEKRRYSNDRGEWYLVSLVVGGRSKSSIHRPELCLPAQGFQMTSPHTVSVNGDDWRIISLTAQDAPSFGFAYTFFNQDGFHTASHVVRIIRDVWDRSLFNRIDRWVMVTVNASRADDEGIVAFLTKLKEIVRCR